MRPILLVENDAVIREELAELLRAQGYTTYEAPGGQQALALLRAVPEPPRLILLDLWTPGMNGWQFCSEKQRDAALAPIPVVLLSGDPDLPAHARSLRAAYLKKPFDIRALLALLAVSLPR